MSLIQVGQRLRIQLRSGKWITDATVLAVGQDALTIKMADGSTKSYDMVKDVVVIEQSAILSV